MKFFIWTRAGGLDEWAKLNFEFNVQEYAHAVAGQLTKDHPSLDVVVLPQDTIPSRGRLS